MTKRFLTLVAALFGVGVASAAEPAKPAIEFRMKSVTDMLPLIEYGGTLAGQTNAVEQVTAVIKLFAEQGKGLEGIDLKKPFGGYVVIAPNVADSPVVLMVPAATEESFLGLLTDRAMLAPKKEKDGSYSMEVPNFPASVHLRFADGYAYLGLRSAEGIAKDKLLSPKDFFAGKSDDVLALNVHIDRIPADLRKVAYGQLELQLNDVVKAADPVEKAFQKFLVDRVTDVAKTVLTDGEKVSVALTADPKADDIQLGVTVTPKSGTPLAKTFTGWADRPSLAGVAARSNGAAFAAGLNFALPSEARAALGKLLDLGAEALIDKAKASDKPVAKMVLDALLPTLKGGEVEFGGALTGPDSKGKFGGLVALRTVGGKEIEKVAKVLAVAVPKEAATVTFDAEKVGDGQRHTVSSPAFNMNPKVASDTVQLYVSDPLVAVTLAPDADGLKALVGAKPAKSPMLFAEVSVVKAFRLGNEVEEEKFRKVIDDAFGKPVRDGEDTVRLTGTGGSDLRLTLTAKGRALSFLRVIGEQR